jgi:hypothetical protein
MLDAQDQKLEEQMKQQGTGQNQPQSGGSGQGDEKGKVKEGQENENDGQGTPQQGGEGAGGEPKEGKGGGGIGDGAPTGGGEEPIKVDGAGEMPGVDAPPQTPQQDGKKPGAGKPVGGADPDPGQTIEELEKARTEREGREGNGDDDSSPSSPSSRPGSNQGFKPARGIGTSNVDSKPKVGDWSDYQGMVVEFAGEIRARQALIDQLRARQLEFEARQTPTEYTQLPIDRDMRRLDRSRYTGMVKRILRDQPIAEKHTENFEGDKTDPIPSNMDVVLLVDGSVSMHASEDAKGNSWPFPPIKAGMHAGCIINEACKSDVTQDRHANFYLGLWGNKEPLMLVKPEDDSQEIGKRIAGVTQSHGWGSSLAPSIRHMTAQLAEGQKQHSGANSKTGYSHIIVLSDGGISDSNASVESVRKLLENCPMTSVDFVVIKNGKTEMDDVAAKLKDRFPGRVGMYHHDSTATVNDGLETLLLERIQNTPITPTVTREHKRATLERAHHAMG